PPTDTLPTAAYALALHDALPSSRFYGRGTGGVRRAPRLRTVFEGNAMKKRMGLMMLALLGAGVLHAQVPQLPDFTYQGRLTQNGDRKSTRLNSSHVKISYAVFCL